MDKFIVQRRIGIPRPQEPRRTRSKKETIAQYIMESVIKAKGKI